MIVNIIKQELDLPRSSLFIQGVLKKFPTLDYNRYKKRPHLTPNHKSSRKEFVSNSINKRTEWSRIVRRDEKVRTRWYSLLFAWFKNRTKVAFQVTIWGRLFNGIGRVCERRHIQFAYYRMHMQRTKVCQHVRRNNSPVFAARMDIYARWY